MTLMPHHRYVDKKSCHIYKTDRKFPARHYSRKLADRKLYCLSDCLFVYLLYGPILPDITEPQR